MVIDVIVTELRTSLDQKHTKNQRPHKPKKKKKRLRLNLPSGQLTCK